jgi:hypothetical protein
MSHLFVLNYLNLFIAARMETVVGWDGGVEECADDWVGFVMMEMCTESFREEVKIEPKWYSNGGNVGDC